MRRTQSKYRGTEQFFKQQDILLIILQRTRRLVCDSKRKLDEMLTQVVQNITWAF